MKWSASCDSTFVLCLFFFFSPGTWEEASQSDELREVEAAWRLTNPSLRCGPTKMTLKVMGRGAVNLELDLGNATVLNFIFEPQNT